MPVFTLAVSNFSMLYLPCFVDLTLQVPVQYCSLQYHTWLSPPETSIAESYPSLVQLIHGLWLLVIALHSSPGVYLTPSDLGGSFSCILSFLLFHTVHGATHLSVLALETPQTREAVGLQSMQSQMSWTQLSEEKQHGFSGQEYWRGLPFPSPVTRFCLNFSLWPVIVGYSIGAWHGS